MDLRSNWKQVADQKTADELVALSRAFHDGIVIHAAWTGREVLNCSRELQLQGYGVLELTIDSQFVEVPRIKLRFLGVRLFRYDYDLDADGVITIGSGGVVARFLSWEVIAEAAEYYATDRREEPGLGV